MKKLSLLLLAMIATASITFAQLTGSRTIPGDYATVAAAVTDLNTQGVGAGGIIFNVAAGHTEISDVPVIDATGTAANTIIFQKNGAGANPKITPLTPGTVASSTTIGGNGDGIVVINGGDYITFDGIDVQTDGAFTAAGMYEYGYYLKKNSATDASKNIVIKNCVITLNKAAIYSFGIFVSNISGTATVTVTSTGGRSENIKIFNNVISNVYGGIQLRGFASATPFDLYDQNIEVGQDGTNTISNYGGGGSTAYGVYAIYQNDLKINNNNISGGDGTTTTQYGVFVSTASNSNVDVNNNTISITNNATSSLVAGIGMSAGTVTGTSNTQNVNNNTITNISRPSVTSGVVYFIYCTSNYPLNLNISNNTLGNSTFATTGAVYGIYQLSNPVNAVINNNTISSITRSSTTSTAAFYGINSDNSTATTATTVSGNTIHSLTGNGSSGAVGGITIATQTVQNVFKNKVYNITSDNAAGVVYGITVAAGSPTVNLYNNLIGDLKAPNNNSATNVDGVRGINITSTTTNASLNISHNTVYLSATSAGANFTSSCLYHTTSATATSGTLNLINNILVNNSTPNGSGFAIAYRRSNATLTNFGSASNNNLFYAGVPDASHVIFYDGTTSDQTLSAYKLRVAPRDANSVSENIISKFLSTTGSSANFLHMDPAQPTQVESGGINVTGITTDYDGDTRNASTPDIGADEFTGVPADLSAPSIIYTPQGATCTTTGVTLTATITDASGVPTSGLGLPVLYWRVNAGAYTAVTATSLGGGQYQFNFGSASVGSQVSYYIVAQDNASTPNVGAAPSVGAGGYSTNPPAASIPPTTPSTFTVYPLLSGTYTVGVGQAYETITAAVITYNNACISGPVTFSLTDATYPTETYPITINQPLASATNTLTFKPAAGVSPVISGTAANIFLFRVLNNYVTFDGSNTVGGTTKDMTVTNTSTTNPASFLFGSTGTTPVTNGTLKNLVLINGVNTTSNVVVGSSTSTPASGAAGYFNNITIQNISSVRSNHGVYLQAVVSPGNGSGTLITGNDLATSGDDAIKQSGVTLIGVDGAKVTNNTIGNFDPTANEIDKGIWLQTGTINTTVSGNTITGLGYTGIAASGNAYGVWVQTANAASNDTIRNNTISGFSSSGKATVVSTTGIYVSLASAGIYIDANKIYNIKSTDSAGYGASGIQLSSTSLAANIQVSNNMIFDIAGFGFGTETGADDNGYGIVVNAGAGYKIYHNTVNMNTNQALVSGLPAAFNVTSAVTAVGAIDLRNNIFVNSQTSGTERYAIYSAAPSNVFSNIDYNDYYSTGPNIGFIGGNRATLTDIQAGFGGNANSRNTNPVFVSATDLHMVSASNGALNSLGTPIASVTIDFDDQSRSATAPDMGADEFDGVVGIDMAAITLVNPAVKSCYTSTENTTVRVLNASASTIDFSVNPVTVNLNVTGAATANLTVVLNSGMLGAGATQDVVMGTIDMSNPGVYTFNANSTVSGDLNTSNDTMTATTRTAVVLVAGSIEASPESFCFTPGTPTITLTGNAGGNIQWQESTVSGTGPWTNVGTNSTTYTPGTAISATTYYRAVVSCGASSGNSNVDTVRLNSPQILTTAPENRCGPGVVNLAATASAGSTINWYSSSTGGSLLATGTSFSPTINSDTTFYVAASSGGSNFSAGRSIPFATSTGFTGNDYGLVFDASQAFTLKTVEVYPTGATGSVTVQLLNSSNAVILTAGPFTIPVGTGTTYGNGATPYTLTLNFEVPVGTAYRLRTTAHTGGPIVRDNPIGAVFSYPLPIGSVGTITSGWLGGSVNANTYYYFYNWQISTGCESARTAVPSTITQCAGTLYVFNGNGLWTDANNWSNGAIPPSPLPSGSEVRIDPVDGDCVLNVPFTVGTGGILTVMAGKNFIIQGNLIRQ